ncbi:MAG: lytic murein transglycosylase [Patescibacteria group bacterium]
MVQKNQKFTSYLKLSSFILGIALFFGPFDAFAAEDTAEIKDDIDRIEEKLKKEQKEYDALASDLSQVRSSLNATQVAISRVQNLLKQTDQTIEQKEKEILGLEQQQELNRKVLTNLIQELYYTNSTPLVEVVLAESDMNELFQTSDSLFSTQEKVQNLIGDINDVKDKVAEEKDSLKETREDHETLLSIQNKQKQGLVFEQNEVAEQLDDQQAVVDKLEKELSELQGDLSKILGKSYNAGDIKEAVAFASKKTGVPKGFLFGVLKMETNLGANVGGCTYAQVEDGAEKNYKNKKLSKRSWQTFLARRDTFKKITKELDIDYRKQKVSCNPSGYTGTGGAMGVAQFMPDTWMGYKSQVASITGHNPPSPWNLTDGVMAMALKLSRVPGVTAGKESAYRNAAAAYLGTSYAPYINGIIYWSKNYKQLL